MENVDAVLNELNIAEFRRWLAKLTSLGYTSSYKVLNAKDYGVPQNRRRIFVVSMLGGRMLDFPKPCPDGRVLRDVLEDDVDESFYLSEDKVAKYRAHDERQRENGTGFGWPPSEPCGISPAVLTSLAKSSTNTVIQYPCATAKGYTDAREGDGLVMNRVLTARGTVQEATAPTLTTGNGCGTGVVVRDNDTIPELPEGEVVAMLTPGRINKRQNGPRCKTDGSSFTITCQDIHGIAENHDGRLRIRYLTPRECWRLMGFPDSAYEAARDVPTSKTQLYKQAGNSIAVPCLEAIFKAIYIDRTWHRRLPLEAWI